MKGHYFVKFIGGPLAGQSINILKRMPNYRTPYYPELPRIDVSSGDPKHLPDYFEYDIHEIAFGGIAFPFGIYQGSDPRHIMNAMWQAYQEKPMHNKEETYYGERLAAPINRNGGE